MIWYCDSCMFSKREKKNAHTHAVHIEQTHKMLAFGWVVIYAYYAKVLQVNARMREH